MEKQPKSNDQDSNDRVQIAQAVFEGLEIIRRSGATNMLDRQMVLHLAREWDFVETADWIERVDTRTYGRLIFQGPEVLEDNLANQAHKHELANGTDENNSIGETDEIDMTEIAWDNARRTMHDLIGTLGKQAILSIADLYQTDHMGVMFLLSRREVINAERDRLIRNLGQASSLWLQLENSITEVQRGVGSLQYLIDPENN